MTVQQRYAKHYKGTGSKWCRIHRPVRIVKIISGLTSQEAIKMEDIECIRVMKEHNDINVCRGGNYNFPETAYWWYVPNEDCNNPETFQRHAQAWIKRAFVSRSRVCQGLFHIVSHLVLNLSSGFYHFSVLGRKFLRQKGN